MLRIGAGRGEDGTATKKVSAQRGRGGDSLTLRGPESSSSRFHENQICCHRFVTFAAVVAWRLGPRRVAFGAPAPNAVFCEGDAGPKGCFLRGLAAQKTVHGGVIAAGALLRGDCSKRGLVRPIAA